MDDLEEFREELVFAFLLIAAGVNAANPEDQYDTALDFREALRNGHFKFSPDEGVRAQLAKAIKRDPGKLKDAP